MMFWTNFIFKNWIVRKSIVSFFSWNRGQSHLWIKISAGISTEMKYSWPHWLNYPSGDFWGRGCVARTSSNLLLGGLSQCVHCKPSAAKILNRSGGTCPVWLGWKCQPATIQPVETTYGTNVKVNIYPWHRLNTRVSSVRLAERLAPFFELHLMSHTWLLF